MAVKAKLMGIDVSLKRSGDKVFLSSRPKAEVSEKQKAQREKFGSAVNSCKGRSKKKDGTVWGVSDFNKCVGDQLKGRSTPTPSE